MIWPLFAIGSAALLLFRPGKKSGTSFPAISFKQPPAHILNALKIASKRYGVPLNILKGVAHTESRYNPRAVSRAGARGLMQLMPAVIRTYGITDAFDPVQNALGGARWLSKLYRKYNNWPKAIAAYNWGPGNVDRKPRLPPQTQAYVKNVMGKAAAA